MNFVPVNNYIYVRAVEDNETEESGILLPQDYRPSEKPFVVVEVVKQCETSTGIWMKGCCLVVEAQMLRDIQHGGKQFTVVKENYIIGMLDLE